MTDDLIFATLDLDDESAENAARVNGWLDAMMRGFHHGRPTDDFRTKWLAAVREDGSLIRGVWEPPALAMSSHVPVATFGHLIKTINAGSATIPAWMITDVTVSPTYRRRGMMRRLMSESLESAVDEGAPVAVLTSSEGGIYQRFGFGPATREARVRVDTSPRFLLRERPVDGGRVVIVDPAEAWPLLATVFDDHHKATRGALGRPAYYTAWLKGYDWHEMSEDPKQRMAMRFGPDGEADGFVVYVIKSGDEVEVNVRDLVTSTPAAYLALWQFLADIDLAEVVVAAAPVVDPLTHALVDHRVRRVTAISDHLWLRVLDVPAALAARPWFGVDRLVLRVLDRLGHADGTFSIDALRGGASITPTSEGPDVTLDVETLGTLYLGDVCVDPLAKARRITGCDDALRRFAAIADGSPAPQCTTHF